MGYMTSILEARLTEPTRDGHRYWITYGRGRPAADSPPRVGVGIHGLRAARLAVWTAAGHEPPPPQSRRTVQPACGDHDCCAPDHLALTVRRRGSPPGDVMRTILADDQTPGIVLARRLGVSRQYVQQIRPGRFPRATS